MASTASFMARIGSTVRETAGNRGGSSWYTPHMAAASRAIAQRIPLADFVLEVRDARIPVSSEFELMRKSSSSSRHIIVLNKVDLANHSQKKDWMKYFEQQKCITFGVNSHNKENIKELLNLLQSKVRELKKVNQSNHTTTVMLVGIPNVGKSALTNSLHQIGRISAAEKGRLKHAVVTPHPGETKDISSFKVASNPNIYILDTPGVLPPYIPDTVVCSKLALTGAIKECIGTERELAQCFLAILNLSGEYRKWEKLTRIEDEISSINKKNEPFGGSELIKGQKKQYVTDHTQDYIVNDVRRTLFDMISSFNGDLEDEKDMVRLIEAQFKALQKAFRLPLESTDESCNKVASKLLNLYHTGRLGHYTLDRAPLVA